EPWRSALPTTPAWYGPTLRMLRMSRMRTRPISTRIFRAGSRRGCGAWTRICTSESTDRTTAQHRLTPCTVCRYLCTYSHQSRALRPCGHVRCPTHVRRRSEDVQMNKSGTASQVISLPKGGGALHGIGEKFSPDVHTGTGNFTVPI